MRWEDESYVRVYTRDTVEWDMLCWQARAVFPLILRKVDRAGLLELGRHGARGLAANLKMPAEVVERALNGDPNQETSPIGLLEDGSIEIRGTKLVVPNFIEAQTAAMSDAQRKRESRARARDSVRTDDSGPIVTKPDVSSQNVTDGHETGQTVTPGHAASESVTYGHSVLFSSELSSSEKAQRARTRVDVDWLFRSWGTWGTRVATPDGGALRDVALKLERYCEATGETDAHALAERAVRDAFVGKLLKSWSFSAAATPQLFNDKWDQIQAVLGGLDPLERRERRGPQQARPASGFIEPRPAVEKTRKVKID